MNSQIFLCHFLKVFADISANVELCQIQGVVGLKEPTFQDLKFLEEQKWWLKGRMSKSFDAKIVSLVS